MTTDPVARLLAAQAGLATRAQLTTAGLSRSALAWRLGRDWRLVLPRVVAAQRGPLSERQRLVAALLYAGPGAALTSLAAAAWHGVTCVPPQHPVHVLVPQNRGPLSSSFVVVRRTTRPDPHPFRRGPLTFVSRARAVADAARDCGSAPTARAVVIEAVQRGLVRLDDVRHELEAGQRRDSRLLRDALQDAEAGAWSGPEADLGRLCRGSRALPQLWLNPDLSAPDGTLLPRPDGWFDDVAMAVQVHSRAYHDGDLWDDTVMSDGIYPEYGIVVVGVTPRRIARSPAAVLARIERSYAAAAQRPRPSVLAAPVGHGLVAPAPR
ncbi:hypothetical protein [Kineosporia sp. A_224]|uniref:hypothetical protein n=1 Tax=Kineosporia sp. A_224 TaxID=1962180 RepID=UPI00117B2C73|nr:hypothetical protein [Kineosporia sp. A_224]